MTEEELNREFIRLTSRPDGLHVMVTRIRWDGPGEPGAYGETAEVLPGTASDEEQQAAIQRVLHDPEYFLVCVECGERKPPGWMHDDRICQGCAERNRHVVY